ncbi:hypothetical protein M231_05308 [Tremella mesenterica]|uniref:Uncharacterized protein n=1 Tax=Tremella mesenterica TaxID=5217 RepID=A0A4Q1BID6_TREME|nr:hypothetical protein M231_05308 [Tremella mesenterica]
MSITASPSLSLLNLEDPHPVPHLRASSYPPRSHPVHSTRPPSPVQLRDQTNPWVTALQHPRPQRHVVMTDSISSIQSGWGIRSVEQARQPEWEPPERFAEVVVGSHMTSGGLEGLEGSGGTGGLGLTGGVGKGKDIYKEKKKDIKRDERDANGSLVVETWARVMDSSKGRDKVLKCLQYSLRTYLYILGLIATIRPHRPWCKSHSKRLKIAVSGLSLTRKCLLLLNPLHPIADLLSPQPMSPRDMFLHLFDLFSALSDDVYCLSRLGLVNKRKGKVADRWANRFWFLTTLMSLYTLHLRTIPHILISRRTEQNEKRMVEARWTNRKLLSDLIFVSYEVFSLSTLREPVQCLTGLLAALISTKKQYEQHSFMVKNA